MFRSIPYLVKQIEQYKLESSKSNSYLKDVIHGDWWKTNILDKWDIGLGFFLDGKPIFKHNKGKVWILYMVILNLPPNIRFVTKKKSIYR